MTICSFDIVFRGTVFWISWLFCGCWPPERKVAQLKVCSIFLSPQWAVGALLSCWRVRCRFPDCIRGGSERNILALINDHATGFPACSKRGSASFSNSNTGCFLAGVEFPMGLRQQNLIHQLFVVC